MHVNERRKWYIGFGIVLIVIVALLLVFQVTWESIFILLAGLVALGLYDRLQTKHTLLRNFPILGHMRYILEFFFFFFQQYFVASDDSERPFDRKTR